MVWKMVQEDIKLACDAKEEMFYCMQVRCWATFEWEISRTGNVKSGSIYLHSVTSKILFVCTPRELPCRQATQSQGLTSEHRPFLSGMSAKFAWCKIHYRSEGQNDWEKIEQNMVSFKNWKNKKTKNNLKFCLSTLTSFANFFYASRWPMTHHAGTGRSCVARYL